MPYLELGDQTLLNGAYTVFVPFLLLDSVINRGLMEIRITPRENGVSTARLEFRNDMSSTLPRMTRKYDNN
uniref:Uncharacterized protein n=1 Tax=Lepeophtheirus salmonis TaxID=72036 RepID=A0A0K2TVH5_LEPSM